MKSYIHLFIIFSIFFASCKSQFETLRNSNQPEKIFAAANKYYEEQSYDKAIALYDIVIQYYRGKKEAEQLFYNYADAHYQIGDYILASTYFKNYATTFTNSPKQSLADYMAAYSNYRLSPNYKLDQSNTIKAIEGFEQFINKYPENEKVSEANQLIDALRYKLEVKSFEQGNLYYKIGSYESAVVSFENTLKDFPETKRAEEIRFLIIKSAFELADKSISEKKNERFNNALEHIQIFNKKYPTSSYKKEIDSINKQISNRLKV
ncbi:MAG: outer membrane protein assembly factor BamD [Saprospiraceae bacterium]|nr:outer membrane protein assembly factor BamD [Saprospiraceae bacterium]MCB9309656.1 outer membrane protein assembly factor BamD [Lewinellaceae bacterium]